HVTLFNPGKYELILKYGTSGELQTYAEWEVLPLAEKRDAKNVILFIGDGMAPSMVSAARMLGHKSINGKYQSQLRFDSAPGFGMQMTHSLDSFITDSANSATALTSGKKSTVNALNAYTDSRGEFDQNPAFETVFEMGRRIYGAKIGIVTTAYLADATPASTVSHTAKRSEYSLILDQFLDGVTNKPWYEFDGVDVILGSGGKYFLAESGNEANKTHLDRFIDRGYNFVHTKEQLEAADASARLLGIFGSDNLPTWLDRNVFTDNLKDFGAYDPVNKTFTGETTDYPGLKEMTLKALDILVAKAKKDDVPFMMMSEAASIDKAMHIGDYHRALGDLLEFDNVVGATLDRLEELGLSEDTLVVVTADHGHGFDVFGSADTEFLRSQPTNETKRAAVGTYGESGLSAYQVAPGVNPSQNFSTVIGEHGEGFPVNWTPRWTAAMGFAAMVDQYEDYATRNVSRESSIENEEGYYVGNIEDAPQGFYISGNLPANGDQGVHSLVDVQVFAWGPGHERFRGIQNSVDIGLKIGHALNVGRQNNVTYHKDSWVKSRN
ncbi:hypothetical protein JCM11251_001264, partial [Rhodosporidiobolus azoricus]